MMNGFVRLQSPIQFEGGKAILTASKELALCIRHGFDHKAPICRIEKELTALGV
jgi:hypothetical protein